MEQKSEGMTEYNAKDYEKRYQGGYGLVYPEGHIIRVHKQILQWELGLTEGRIFDFGCGTGAHLRYFADHGFEPYGCDTSATAVARCKELLPDFADHIKLTPVLPDLRKDFQAESFDVFMSNQVLYFLDTAGIRHIVDQAAEMVRPGGIFFATMMSYSCWYIRYVVEQIGEFKRVRLDTTRTKNDGDLLIKFVLAEELATLFAPFRPIHIGSYGSHIRQEEGSTDHWLFVGIR